MNDELIEIFKKGANTFDIQLSNLEIKDFFSFMNLLKEWNTKINLTSIIDEKEIILKHFIDSLSILPFIKNKKSTFIDVGTGAGFPGIPINIVHRNLKVTLLDSLEKRIKFLNIIKNSLNLENLITIHGRSEDLGALHNHRQKYDYAVSRAVASLPVLLEYCLPFVKIDGVFIAMKGSNIEEIDNSKKSLELLGGKIEEIKSFTLPFSDIKRNIIIIRKFRQTLIKYPRKAGIPLKNPLQ